MSGSVGRDISILVVGGAIVGFNDAHFLRVRQLIHRQRIIPFRVWFITVITHVLLLIDNSWFTTLSGLSLLIANLLDSKQKTVIHKIKLLEKCHILLDLLLNLVNITSLEFDKVLNLLLFVAFHSLQIDIFES